MRLTMPQVGIVPSIQTNSQTRRFDNDYVPNLPNIIEDEEEIDLNELQNTFMTEYDDDMDEEPDISLVFEIRKLEDSEFNLRFRFLDINQLVEIYPFEENYTRFNPRSNNLTINQIIEMSSNIDMYNIIDTMNVLETNQYYVIFEQVI